MSLFLRSSTATTNTIIKTPNRFLRKNRKWPNPHYKTKFQIIFNQQKALHNLKHLAKSSPNQQEEQEQDQKSQIPIFPNQPYLLTCLINSFNEHKCEPTPIAYHFILKTLTLTIGTQLKEVDLVLTHLEKVETFDTPEWVLVDLIRVYCKKGFFEEAVELFFRIPRFRCVATAASLNVLLGWMCRNEEVIGLVPGVLVRCSRDMNVRIEGSSVEILIEALCRMRKVDHAIELLKCLVDEGIDPDRKVYSSILSALCKRNGTASSEVLGIYGEMKRMRLERDKFDFGNVIRFLVKQGKGIDALRVLGEMKKEVLKPDIACYNMVLRGLVEGGHFARAEELFDEFLLIGFIPNIHTYNVYIAGLCKQKNVEAGYKMIGCMEQMGCEPDSMTYNMVLEGFYKLGDSNRVEEVWMDMELKKLLNFETYLIMVCSLVKRCNILEACKKLEEGLTSGLVIASSKIDEAVCMLCKGGFVVEASDIVKKLFSFGISLGAKAWEALILGLKLNLSFTSIQSDQLGLLGDDLSSLWKAALCD
ncbi:Pentatricopeptide repeat-containing protein [Drosera capensis]